MIMLGIRTALVSLVGLVILAPTASDAAAPQQKATPTSRPAAPTPGPIAVGRNVQVSRDIDGAHYEVHAAAHPSDPARLLVGAISPQNVRKTMLYVSGDGGQSWRRPFTGSALQSTGVPAVAYGPDGAAYFAALTLKAQSPPYPHPARDGAGRQTLLYRSPDGGADWEGVVTLPFVDREYVVVDASKSPYHGRVYVTGDPRPASGFIVYTSTDSGRTFATPGVAADAHGGTSIGNAVVAADGTLLGVFADTHHVRVVASTDGGQSLRPSVAVDTFVPAAGRGEATRPNVNYFLILAIDASRGPYKDRLYVVWPDRRQGRSQIYFASSSDKGATWSPARVITDNPPTDTTDQFMPTLAVNQAGVVGLLWYDRRDHPDNRGYYPRFAASLDGGATWTPSVRVSTAPYTGKGEVGGGGGSFAGNGGDTAGLAAGAEGVFHPVWIDDRSGSPQVWTAAVTVRGRVPGGARAAPP